MQQVCSIGLARLESTPADESTGGDESEPAAAEVSTPAVVPEPEADSSSESCSDGDD